MPAKIQTEQHRALATARHAAREGDVELAWQWLQKAHAIYPVTKQQRQSIQKEFTDYEQKNIPN